MRSPAHLHSYQVCIKFKKKENWWDNARLTILGHLGHGLRGFLFSLLVLAQNH